MKKKKGFTLVELLVVIAIIALLMGILMPALAKVRQLAYRMVCGTNLSGIGKAMLVYSNDNDENFPRAGGRNSEWSSAGEISTWTARRESGAGFDNGATVTASFFLLVKYADVSANQFLCKGDIGVSEFKLSGYGAATTVDDTVDVWDFGSNPSAHCSYSYHMPYNENGGVLGYGLSAASNPGSPVAGDRNPYLDKNAEIYLFGVIDGEEEPIWATSNVLGQASYYSDIDKTGNAAAHQREGQNILFLDSHVSFEKFPNVGISNDNIWKYWPGGESPSNVEDKQVDPQNTGAPLLPGDGVPGDYKDAYLISEKQGVGGRTF